MKFYIHKLGCPKNDVDADYIAARLISEGHEPVESPEEADSVIVNTCGFIQPAKEESIEEILKLGQLKKEGQIQKLYASGCLSQKHGDELLDGMPELDGTFGLGALDEIAERQRAVGRIDFYIANGSHPVVLEFADGTVSVHSSRGKHLLDMPVHPAHFGAANIPPVIILRNFSVMFHDRGL